jgi:hypothetical protein
MHKDLLSVTLGMRWTNQDNEENMDLEPREMQRKLAFVVKI